MTTIRTKEGIVDEGCHANSKAAPYETNADEAQTIMGYYGRWHHLNTSDISRLGICVDVKTLDREVA